MLTTGIFDLQLCCVMNEWAYFTSCPVALQWGDDWNDAPYEHNAGEPYEYHYQIVDGVKTYVNHTIVKIAWTGNVDPPCSGYTNSHWSVEQINNGDVPWLSNRFFTSENNIDNVYSGIALREFVEFIRRNAGEVYVPLSYVEDTTYEYTVEPASASASASASQNLSDVFRGEFG